MTKNIENASEVRVNQMEIENRSESKLNIQNSGHITISDANSTAEVLHKKEAKIDEIEIKKIEEIEI